MREPVLLTVRNRNARFPFHLRVPTSDVASFEQIFLRQEYKLRYSRAPRTIIDAGASIGLASIYWSTLFPEAKILAIEAEASNFELLRRNTAPYGNVIPLHRALWNRCTMLEIDDPGLGKWGFAVRDTSGATGDRTRGRVQGITVDNLLGEYAIDRIDLLKLDIEGAEREVFMESASWIDRVDAVIAELHERLRPGCNRSFYRGTDGFTEEWVQGENVCLARSGAAVVGPPGRA